MSNLNDAQGGAVVTWRVAAGTQAANNVTSGGALRIYSIEVSAATDAAQVRVYNALTATGTPVELEVPAGSSRQMWFDAPGFYHGTGLSVAIPVAVTFAQITYALE